MTNSERQLRLWPGIAAVLLQWLIRFGVPVVAPDVTPFAMMGALLCGLGIVVWWAFFSRAPRLERWGAIPLIVAVMAGTSRALHPSIATGMMGMLFVMYAVPILSLTLVAWAAVTRRVGAGLRRASFVVAVLLACGGFALLRTEGITAEAQSQFAWRWTKTPEQKLPPAEPAIAPPPAPLEASVPRAPARVAPEWPGFRGPHRDGKVTGVRIKTDWTSTPPIELWRRPVGPGWSSFAVGGGLLYTQEQRGESELVSCYNAATGKPVWTHRDAARFWESNAGAGPRGTPALHDGRVYTFGATGILNALEAGNGAVVWTRNAAKDTGAQLPGWGFSSSPLVLDDAVIVAASGRLAAYDIATGEPRWLGPKSRESYASPHLLEIGGVPQILLLTAEGVTSVGRADGKLLWSHAWPGFTALQPAMTADGGVLITTGSPAGGLGTRRLAVAHGETGWTAQELWTSNGLKPYFNDLVVHQGHAYGFDGGILSCIDLQDGKRKWKGGRYGHGQMLLLADQNLLLVLSEEGELALVQALPGQFTELARVPALDGKTWNHPVLVGDTLLLRNDREMAAFHLP